jgi:aminobenzoyl-glutamate utilization protein B
MNGFWPSCRHCSGERSTRLAAPPFELAIFSRQEIGMTTALFATLCLLAQPAPPAVGPASGTLVVVGGGALPATTTRKFVELAGGPDSDFVLIPTASETDPVDLKREEQTFVRQFGVKTVAVLHTRDRAEADTEAFVAPLLKARAVWFGGGRQWRLVDSYLGTRTQRELEAVLARGGVIGGSSAGATIQGSYLVRGAREGNQIMMAPGYEQGFGYLRGVAVDQHLLARNRQQDLVAVIEKKPELLGLGLDETAAILVQGDRMEVIGRSVVGIYDGKEHDGKRYYFLAPGEQFDLRTRKRLAGREPIGAGPATTAANPPDPGRSTAQPGADGFIKAHADRSWEMAQRIWEWAEVGYQEKRSAALLADAMEAGGFRVERGVAGIPTAFIARVGSVKPVIGILGEYDALPGLSQQAMPERQARPGVTAGHGCGHHLLGVAAASACLALAEQIRAGTLTGTLRFYGCPAEEGGSAKAFMVREHLFDDCDAVLHWHPASQNSAGGDSSQARIAAKFRFHGTSSHAAGAPEAGRSALDAIELTNHAAELLREHTPDFTRIHHVVTAGGRAPNVVPDFGEVFYYVRHPRSDVVQALYGRLLKCAEAGALATETRLETQYLGGILEILPNDALGRVARANLTRLNDLKYDEAEARFAARIQQSLSRPPSLTSVAGVADRSGQGAGGSTDVGDVSWVVPTVGFTTACWVPGTSAHSWQAAAAGGTTIGRKGMILASRVLAATACELFQSPPLLRAARDEHQRRLVGRSYQSLLGPLQKPPLDYRETPVQSGP